MAMRRDGRRAEDYARRHDVRRWTTDAEALIAYLGVDAVYVATPAGSRLDYALKVCATGKPCYVEKPMARNATEGDAMVTAFRFSIVGPLQAVQGCAANVASDPAVEDTAAITFRLASGATGMASWSEARRQTGSTCRTPSTSSNR